MERLFAYLLSNSQGGNSTHKVKSSQVKPNQAFIRVSVDFDGIFSFFSLFQEGIAIPKFHQIR